MKYISDRDVEIVSGLLTEEALCGVYGGRGAKEGGVLRDRRRAREHAKTTAEAFNRALQKNGGPFDDIDAAREATRVELELDWGLIARGVRILLKVVSVLYPQSRLFIIVFDALFTYWTSQNAGAAPVTH